ncbi:DUF6265 family protein [Nannocystis radixulma]|uniref:DUF6265 family protein n=1 Tax=Nannocystis radixulma TaxID=2995305 RepID=A0ABT5BJT6_9BACT|nr:DUF6265 family protein [Nannocystis radixulma]MDC0674398.1 DUF6265 family protein [Nannocystis radixulma]
MSGYSPAMRPGSSLLAVTLVAVAELGCGHAAPAAEALGPLCGTWEQRDGWIVTETWRRVKGGLQGRSTTADPNGKIIELEEMRLTVGPGGSIYHAEPAGGTPTEFTETTDPALVPAAGERVWIWVHPTHDFPRRIVYRLAGDRLTATISNPNGDEEQRRGRTWEYRRTGACSG